MKKKITYLTIFVFSILFTFTNCDSGTVTENEYLTSYHRTDQLVHLYDKGILPLHQSFENETQILIDKSQIFSTNLTAETYIDLQNQWKKTAAIWKRCELFDIGIVNTSFIHFKIHRWPINETKIEEYIDGTSVIDVPLIVSKGSSAKGIGAIEYLLFNYKLSELQQNSRRIEYLKALTVNLNNNAKEVKNLWVSYEDNFKNGVENGISGSQNMLLNSIISSIEETIISKIGKALGEKNGGNLDLQELEAFRSQYSLELMKNTLKSIKSCFTGDFDTKDRKLGFNSYFASFDDATLANKINAKILNCETQLSAFNDRLENTLTTNTNQIKLVKEAYRDLLLLIKVDVSSFLGSTLTFNENDGD